MINENLQSYVTHERERGVSDGDIRAALRTQGWKEEDVNEVFAGVPSSAVVHHSESRKFEFMNMFKGRLRRWPYFVTGLLIGISAYVILFFVENESILINLIFVIILAPISLSLGIRRIHDLNWSGWFVLLQLIPFVGFIFALIMLFMKGTDGPNSYGLPQGDRSFIPTLLNM